MTLVKLCIFKSNEKPAIGDRTPWSQKLVFQIPEKFAPRKTKKQVAARIKERCYFFNKRLHCFV